MVESEREDVKREIIVYLSTNLIEQALRRDDPELWRGAFRVEEGLPPGARFRGVFDDPGHGRIGLVFEHESFAPVRPGEVRLAIDIVVTGAHPVRIAREE